MEVYPSSPRSPRGLMSTSSRLTLAPKTTALLSGPLPALEQAKLRTTSTRETAGDSFRAVRFNNATQVVPALVETTTVDLLDDWGWSPLMHAAEQNHKQMHVKKLLAAGADATIRSAKKYGMYPAGSTALDIAKQVQASVGFDRLAVIALLEGASAKQKEQRYVEAQELLGERHSHELAVMNMQRSAEANATQAAARRAEVRALAVKTAQEQQAAEEQRRSEAVAAREEMHRQMADKYSSPRLLGTGPPPPSPLEPQPQPEPETEPEPEPEPTSSVDRAQQLREEMAARNARLVQPTSSAASDDDGHHVRHTLPPAACLFAGSKLFPKR